MNYWGWGEINSAYYPYLLAFMEWLGKVRLCGR